MGEYPVFTQNDITQFQNSVIIKNNYYQVIDKLLLNMNIARINKYNQVEWSDDVYIDEDKMNMIIRIRDSLQQIFPYEVEFVHQLEVYISSAIIN